jgi:phosphoglycerate dehydrogenase-like enzyme
MMAYQVAFLDPVHPNIRALVDANLPKDWEISFAASRDEQDPRAAVANADAAFVIGTGIDAGLLDAAPKLTFVQKLGSGTDRIDRRACLAHGVTVARLEGGNAVQVAEHTVMLMLSALRRLPYFDRNTRGGEWLKEEGRGTQRQLAGKKVGLVGLGAIGREVAKRLRGFDVTLVYYDPMPVGSAVEQELSIVRYELGELLSTSDIVSLHLPLLAQTKHLLNERRISLLKRGATVINCARGGLVEEAALVRALDNGDILAAAFDTFEEEPPRSSPLLARNDVILTPHLAGATLENFEVVLRRGFRNLQLFLRGEPLIAGELVVDCPSTK